MNQNAIDPVFLALQDRIAQLEAELSNAQPTTFEDDFNIVQIGLSGGDIQALISTREVPGQYVVRDITLTVKQLAGLLTNAPIKVYSYELAYKTLAYHVLLERRRTARTEEGRIIPGPEVWAVHNITADSYLDTEGHWAYTPHGNTELLEVFYRETRFASIAEALTAWYEYGRDSLEKLYNR